MKINSILLFIALFLSNEILAQKETIVLAAQGGVGVGSLGGNATDFLYSTGRIPRSSIEFAGSYVYGINVGYMITKRVGLSSGIVYDNTSWKLETVNSRKSKTTTQQRIQIPFLIRLETPVPRRRGSYFFNLGGNISYLQDIKDNIYGPFNPSIEQEFNDVTYALQGTVGAFAPIHKLLWLTLGIDGQYQVSNNFVVPGLKGHLYTLYFFAGVSLRL